MARGFFVAVGIFVVLLGLECLVIDRVFLRSDIPQPPPGAQQQQSLSSTFQFRSLSTQQAPPQRQYQPPEWAPWSCIAGGIVTVIYAFALPKKISINA